MNRKDLFESMAGIDDAILERSERRRPVRRPWLGAVAAVLALVIVTTAALSSLRMGSRVTQSNDAANSSSAELPETYEPAATPEPAVVTLAQPDYPAKARRLIAGERAWLTAALESLGLRTFPSRVNYILFQAPGVDDLKERLLERGVLIRSCANYVGLGPDYYRVAVRLHWENEGLMRAMREVL